MSLSLYSPQQDQQKSIFKILNPQKQAELTGEFISSLTKRMRSQKKRITLSFEQAFAASAERLEERSRSLNVNITELKLLEIEALLNSRFVSQINKMPAIWQKTFASLDSSWMPEIKQTAKRVFAWMLKRPQDALVFFKEVEPYLLPLEKKEWIKEGVQIFVEKEDVLTDSKKQKILKVFNLEGSNVAKEELEEVWKPAHEIVLETLEQELNASRAIFTETNLMSEPSLWRNIWKPAVASKADEAVKKRLTEICLAIAFDSPERALDLLTVLDSSNIQFLQGHSAWSSHCERFAASFQKNLQMLKEEHRLMKACPEAFDSSMAVAYKDRLKDWVQKHDCPEQIFTMVFQFLKIAREPKDFVDLIQAVREKKCDLCFALELIELLKPCGDNQIDEEIWEIIAQSLQIALVCNNKKAKLIVKACEALKKQSSNSLKRLSHGIWDTIDKSLVVLFESNAELAQQVAFTRLKVLLAKAAQGEQYSQEVFAFFEKYFCKTGEPLKSLWLDEFISFYEKLPDTEGMSVADDAAYGILIKAFKGQKYSSELQALRMLDQLVLRGEKSSKGCLRAILFFDAFEWSSPKSSFELVKMYEKSYPLLNKDERNSIFDQLADLLVKKTPSVKKINRDNSKRAPLMELLIKSCPLAKVSGDSDFSEKILSRFKMSYSRIADFQSEMAFFEAYLKIEQPLSEDLVKMVFHLEDGRSQRLLDRWEAMSLHPVISKYTVNLLKEGIKRALSVVEQRKRADCLYDVICALVFLYNSKNPYSEKLLKKGFFCLLEFLKANVEPEDLDYQEGSSKNVNEIFFVFLKENLARLEGTSSRLFYYDLLKKWCAYLEKEKENSNFQLSFKYLMEIYEVFLLDKRKNILVADSMTCLLKGCALLSLTDQATLTRLRTAIELTHQQGCYEENPLLYQKHLDSINIENVPDPDNNSACEVAAPNLFDLSIAVIIQSFPKGFASGGSAFWRMCQGVTNGLQKLPSNTRTFYLINKFLRAVYPASQTVGKVAGQFELSCPSVHTAVSKMFEICEIQIASVIQCENPDKAHLQTAVNMLKLIGCWLFIINQQGGFPLSGEEYCEHLLRLLEMYRLLMNSNRCSLTVLENLIHDVFGARLYFHPLYAIRSEKFSSPGRERLSEAFWKWCELAEPHYVQLIEKNPESSIYKTFDDDPEKSLNWALWLANHNISGALANMIASL